MTDSSSDADCGQRATYQSNRWARANERVAASKPREDTARRKSENIMRISSPARPGRRPVRSEPRWPSRPDVAWDWNLTDQVEHGPVIWKYHGLGPARSVRPGSAPPAKDGPTRKDRWI